MQIRALWAMILVIAGFPGITSAQEIWEIDDANGQVLYAPVILYDSGGPNGQYGNNESYEVTICTGIELAGCPPIPPLVALFNPGSIDIEAHPFCQFDGLVFENIDTYCNDNYPPLYNTTATCYLYEENGCMTVRFYSDGGLVADGFEVHFEAGNQVAADGPILTCPDPVDGTVLFDIHGNPTQIGTYDCGGQTLDLYWADEVRHFIVAEGIVTLTLTGPEDIDAFIYGQAIDVGPNGCPPISLIGCLIDDETEITFNASDYPFGIWVIVDSDGFGGDYTLSLLCDPCPNTPVECDEVYSGTFPGLQFSEFDLYCDDTPFLGGERIYTFVPDETGWYTFHTESFPLAPSIIVTDCCLGGGTIGLQGITCDFCAYSGPVDVAQNQLELFLQAGVTYYIYIEDQTGSPYEFWVECPALSCEDIIEIDCEFFIEDTNDPDEVDPSPGTGITDFIDSHSDCNGTIDGCEISGGTGQFAEPEVLYRYIHSQFNPGGVLDNVCIDVFPRQPGLDVDLFLYEDCIVDQPENCVVSSKRKPGLIDGILLQEVFPGQEYIVVVDGQSNATPDNTGRYDLYVTCGNLCEKEAQPLFCDIPVLGSLQPADGNVSSHYCCALTENFPDNNNGNTGPDYSGGGNTGPEDLYYFDVTTPGTTIEIHLEILTPGRDLELFLLQSCDVTTCLERSIDAPGESETITHILQPGRYYVVVEGHDFDEGDYRLTVSGCGDCALFIPYPGGSPNQVFFDNTTGWECKYFLVQSPYDSLNSGNFTFIDSIPVNSLEDPQYYFPFPGCYELCFYYCDPAGNIYECCFKYCAEIKRYDCIDRPELTIVEERPQDCTIRVSCGGGFIPQSPPRGEAGGDSSHVTIMNVETGLTQQYDPDVDIILPYGEYEICCWTWDPVCMYWDICCRVVCLPYIRPFEEECLQGGITTVQQGNQYLFTYGAPTLSVEWTILPNIPHTVQGDQLIVNNPPPGNYKVCAIYDSSMGGGIIIRDTCCVYLCVDEGFNPGEENCFDIIPYGPGHVLLQCTSGRPVLRWEVVEWILPVPIVVGIYYGENPLVQLEPGKRYRIRKYFVGCCGEEEFCEKEICFEDPFDCHVIRPLYIGQFGQPGDLRYRFELEPGYEGSIWKIDETGEIIGQGVNSVEYLFPAPGDYTISVIIWDPFSDCYRICCKRIRAGYPYDCGLLYVTFTGDEDHTSTYDIFLLDDCNIGQITSQAQSMQQWMINGQHIPEFDGLSTLRGIDLTLYLPPGETVAYICVMWYDPCLKLCRWCCYKLEILPPFPCDLFTPVFVSQNQYTFTATGNYEDTYWGIGGLDDIFNSGANTFDLNDPVIQNYIVESGATSIYVYFYYRVNGCWRVCCRKICLDGRPNCDGVGDYCDYYVNSFEEDFDPETPNGYPYMEGDTLRENDFWWSGPGGIVVDEEAHLADQDSVHLSLTNTITGNGGILKVAFDMEVEWIWSLGYQPFIEGDFCLTDENKNCISPTFQELFATPGLVQLDVCDGIGDIGYCFSRVEILVRFNDFYAIFIDGRLVYEDQDFDDVTFFLSFYGELVFDNVCVAECKQCEEPVFDPDAYTYCPDIWLTGFEDLPNGQHVPTFAADTLGLGWSLYNTSGILINELVTPDSTWTCPPLNPGTTYYICHTVIDENGCESLCCIKVNIPADCGLFTPYFSGDENTLSYRFETDPAQTAGLEIIEWYVGDQRVAGAQPALNYTFPSPGTYTVCCIFWDPLTQCFIWCCREVCVDFPLDCDRIIIDYDGTGEEYILSVSGVADIISWNIDQPAGLPNQGYIGDDNPQRFDPADYGILPGQEIIISVRYIDPDGCIRICCRRICLPVNTPQEECNNIFPLYLGEGYRYQYYVGPGMDMNDIHWRLHIPGTDEVLDIGEGMMSDELDFEALQQLYPSLGLENVCISILYRDLTDGCYKICCKCFCIETLPLDCDDILFYYTGDPVDRLKYHFEVEATGISQIEWKIDESQTVISQSSFFDVDFADYGLTIGNTITVTVRYFDPVSDCYRICCKRICLVNPYPAEGCDAISHGGLNGNLIALSTSSPDPVWTIEGLTGVYATTSSAVVDITDPQLAPVVNGATEITICLTYMDAGCCQTCCETICIVTSGPTCDNLSVSYTGSGNLFTLQIEDDNTISGLSTTITLPSGQDVQLGGTISMYEVTMEGTYTICRTYPDGCDGTLTCCEEICISNELICLPISFTIDPQDEHLFTFTHSIIGGASYLWDFGDGTTSTSDLTSVIHTFPDTGGPFTVCLTVTDECGEMCVQCVTIAIGALNVNPVVADPSCQGVNDGSIDLNIAGGAPPVTIQWSTGVSGNELLTGLGAGTYTATITDGLGVDTSFTFVLSAPPAPALDVLITPTSCGEANGAISITATNGVTLIDFVWSPALTDDDGTVSSLSSGTYTVTVTDEYGCQNVLDPLIVNPSATISPIVFGPDTTACPGDTVWLATGVINAGNINITWYRDGEEIATNVTEIPVTSSGLYHVLVSNNENCSRSDTMQVTFFESGIVFPSDMTNIVPGTQIILTLNGAASVLWSSEDVPLSCTSCPETTFPIFGTSLVLVEATDENGCIASDSIFLEVDLSPVEGPNFLTPNGDGINDLLHFNNLELFEFRTLILFNRWGQILLEIDPYDNQWDGTIDGHALPDGVYYYVLDYGQTIPGQFQFKSDLTIIRGR